MKTVTLQHPVELNGAKYETIGLIRLKWGDVRRSVAKANKSEVEITSLLIDASLRSESGGVLPENFIDHVDLEDLPEIMGFLTPIFQKLKGLI